MGIRRFLRKTWVKVTLILVGSIVALLLGAFGIFKWRFIPSVPEPDFPQPTSQIEAFEQDLDYLALYATLEKAFDEDAKREAFADYLASVRGQLDTMTPMRFEVLVAQAVALADNGHSNVSPIGLTRRINHFPIRTGPFEDGEFVIQAQRQYENLLGAELVAVEDHPIADVVDAFVPMFGGVEQRSRFFTHLFINSPALLHAQGFSASADGTLLTFKLPDGEFRDVYLEGALPEDGRRLPFGREVMDYRVPEEDAPDWLHLMAGKEAPPYLAEPDEPYLYRHLEEANGAYVKINYNYDVGERSLINWLGEVADDMRARQPDFAVVDLRFNGGGTDATNRFAKDLPSLLSNDGTIYVVTSRETFSAGIGAAAQIKRFGGPRVRIVGGPVGDRLRFVANGGTLFKLPNSGIGIRVWSSWEDYADGCWDWGECFWLSPFFRTEGVGDLEPNVRVPMNFSDYASNRDAVMEFILTDAARPASDR
jgi:hypothetical protein